MNLVTSLPTSRLLKEAGIEQGKSCFVWCGDKCDSFGNESYELLTREQSQDVYSVGRDKLWDFVIAAFTTDELLEILPGDISTAKEGGRLEIKKWSHGFECNYFYYDQDRDSYEVFNNEDNKLLPEALASLLIKVREK